jgi:hypothetical protein
MAIRALLRRFPDPTAILRVLSTGRRRPSVLKATVLLLAMTAALASPTLAGTADAVTDPSVSGQQAAANTVLDQFD